jgi:hypothetical protein
MILLHHLKTKIRGNVTIHNKRERLLKTRFQTRPSRIRIVKKRKKSSNVLNRKKNEENIRKS